MSQAVSISARQEVPAPRADTSLPWVSAASSPTQEPATRLAAVVASAQALMLSTFRSTAVVVVLAEALGPLVASAAVSVSVHTLGSAEAAASVVSLLASAVLAQTWAPPGAIVAIPGRVRAAGSAGTSTDLCAAIKPKQ